MKKIEIVSNKKLSNIRYDITAKDKYLVCSWQGWNKKSIAELLVIDKTTDTILWTYSFSSNGIGRPTIYNNYIYVASDEEAYCFELLTGLIKWQVKEKKGFFSDVLHPQLHKGNVYFFNCDEHCLTDIYAFDPYTGSRILHIKNLLEHSRGRDVYLSESFIKYNPSKRGTSIFSSTLYTLPDLKPIASKIGDFWLHENFILLKTKNEIQKYNLNDMSQAIWTQKLKTYSNAEKTFLAVASDWLWVICEDQDGIYVTYLSLEKGNLETKIRLEGSYYKRHLLITDWLVINTDDSLVCIDVKEKKELWSFDTDGSYKTRLTYHDGNLIYGDHSGYCAAINMQSGDMIWEFSLPETEGKKYGGDFHVTDTHLYYGLERWIQKIPLTELSV